MEVRCRGTFSHISGVEIITTPDDAGQRDRSIVGASGVEWGGPLRLPWEPTTDFGWNAVGPCGCPDIPICTPPLLRVMMEGYKDNPLQVLS